MTKLLPLNRGLFTLVDDADFDALRQFNWFADRASYVYRTIQANGKNKNIRLHRELLNAPPELEVDHINQDPLDNRRVNIRTVTRLQNAQNFRGARAHSTTGVRGVQIQNPGRWTGRYRARLTVNHKVIRLGGYPTIEEAEAAVKAARAVFMTHAPESQRAAP